ncbi:hypothetical protein FB45DRAFT_1058921 [Roridomyces roridus]|uniref:Uncharacterized protein n=1 Tax=Roridomyces roridus TaxID=1738132 RepID=A0AAD7BVV1_9AGAR|nr:hypothetical protein FB45DRAFT_1058921 [Roridomyces roridus]
MRGDNPTVSDLLSFILPTAPPFPNSSNQATASWSALRMPPEEDFLTCSFPETIDDQIYDEIMQRGRDELLRRGFLNRALPAEIISIIDVFVASYSSTPVSSERDIDLHISALTCFVISPLIQWITAGDNEPCQAHAKYPSQRGGYNVVRIPQILAPFDPEPLRAFSADNTMPLVSISHAREIHQCNHSTYQGQHDGKSMLVKLFLHVSALNKEPNIGLLFDGWTITICQKVYLPNGHWALAVSKGRPATIQQTHPSTQKSQIWQGNSKPIPLIGLFLCLLLLPDSPLHAIQVPDSVQAMAKAISPAELLRRIPTIEKRDKDGAGNRKNSNAHPAFSPPEEVLLHVQIGSIPSSSPGSCTSTLPSLAALTMLSIGERATVWSGKLMGEPVKIKFYDSDDLAQEALETEKACYERLSGLQLTPRYYGVYRGEECALVLGDGGDAFEDQWSFSGLDDTDKDALFTLVKQVHAAGVAHHALEPSHVVRGPQGLRLIDFFQGDPEHYCNGTCDELQRLWDKLSDNTTYIRG